MIKLSTPEDFDTLQSSMNAITTESYCSGLYIEEELLPAVQSGNWDKLSKMIIYKDEKKTIYFHENRWAFLDSNIKAKNINNFNFGITDSFPENVRLIGKCEQQLINEIKSFALTEMYVSKTKKELNSILSNVLKLKNTARVCLEKGISSFQELTLESFKGWVADGVDFTRKAIFSGLNGLKKNQKALSFNIHYPLLTHKLLNITKAKPDGYQVIPFRIYSSLINELTEDIEQAYSIRADIEKAVEQRHKKIDEAFADKIRKLRIGKFKLGKRERKTLSVKNFIKALSERGIDLIDNEEDDGWIEVYKEVKPTFAIASDFNNIKINVGQKVYSWNKFRLYLSRLQEKSAWLCLLLSGMRMDELVSMYPAYGAQIVEFEKEGGDGIEKVHVLTTRQSKLSMSSQKKDDVYVTNYTGHKAFHLLNAITNPYRNRASDNDLDKLFFNLQKYKVVATAKSSLGLSLSDFLKKHTRIDLMLTSDDIKNLNTSDKDHKWKVGEKFHITPHMARRSLAYYLVGYELCSFPALKQQLGHFSMGMTRWYTRNASSYQKFWKEVDDERINQKANIYKRIFERIANNERVAGGKGKAYIKFIGKEGEVFFEEGANKRLLTKSYWENMLRNKKEHLHAIAPGMYCSNNACSMRIQIDLTECVDCEYDYIEDVTYAESSRIDAMRELEVMKEFNELTPGEASRCVLRIKAAERIMTDLDFDYEPYQFSPDVLDMMIQVKGVE